jgi:hypothetical protein
VTKKVKRQPDGGAVDKRGGAPTHYSPEAWEDRQREVQEALRKRRKRGRQAIGKGGA